MGIPVAGQVFMFNDVSSWKPLLSWFRFLCNFSEFIYIYQVASTAEVCKVYILVQLLTYLTFLKNKWWNLTKQ